MGATALELRDVLKTLARNAVRLEIGAGDDPEIGRFGGAPDVPEGFDWPWFAKDTYVDDEVKPRSLTFLCQFDCAALAELDRDGLLPHEGVLSFFYETVSQRWGYGPEDGGCARVIWFPDKGALRPAAFPADLEWYCRFPSLPIRGRAVTEYPGYEEFAAQPDLLASCRGKDRNPWDVFRSFRAAQPDYREVPPPLAPPSGLAGHHPEGHGPGVRPHQPGVFHGPRLPGHPGGGSPGDGGGLPGRVAAAVPTGQRRLRGGLLPGLRGQRKHLLLHPKRGPGRPPL